MSHTHYCHARLQAEPAAVLAAVAAVQCSTREHESRQEPDGDAHGTGAGKADRKTGTLERNGSHGTTGDYLTSSDGSRTGLSALAVRQDRRTLTSS